MNAEADWGLNSAKLFVKSIRAPIVAYEMPNVSGGGHYCSAAYRTQSTLIGWPEEEKQARQILKASGTKFEVVDLSSSRKRQVGAWLGGVKLTTTLVLENSSRAKYESLKAILN